MAIDPLQMIGQTIVGVSKIEPLVFESSPKVPVAFDEEAMVVTKIIIERIAAAEFGFCEIAAKRVGRVLLENVARVLVRRAGGRLRLKLLCAGNGGGDGAENQAGKEQSYIFHRLRCGQRCIG